MNYVFGPIFVLVLVLAGGLSVVGMATSESSETICHKHGTITGRPVTMNAGYCYEQRDGSWALVPFRGAR